MNWELRKMRAYMTHNELKPLVGKVINLTFKNTAMAVTVIGTLHRNEDNGGWSVIGNDAEWHFMSDSFKEVRVMDSHIGILVVEVY